MAKLGNMNDIAAAIRGFHKGPTMTDDQLRTLARVILSTGFAAGVTWALSDAEADTCRPTLDATLTDNIDFFRTVANSAGAYKKLTEGVRDLTNG